MERGEGEGRGRWGIHTAEDSRGWVVHKFVFDVDVLGVFHGQGCVHCKESVKGGDLEIRHAAGRGFRERGGSLKAVEDRGVT